jgi:hypothetical protein
VGVASGTGITLAGGTCDASARSAGFQYDASRFSVCSRCVISALFWPCRMGGASGIGIILAAPPCSQCAFSVMQVDFQ